MAKRFYSGKTYTHATGHSCAFRQWKADSHCNLIHGYALQFEFTFGGNELDDRNWIVDFGGLKPLKNWLAEMFDHTYLVATNDPELETFKMLDEKGLIDLRMVGGTGCELFAEMAFDKADEIVKELTDGRCWVQKVTVREHEANSATVELNDHQKVFEKVL
jgi:6-pyruvoyltetrahydropterin/6-carboxytetrahydropterin synthase|tara:strand:+ start:1056 stop:1538 length:483 start_codon:yes stop_codon:yes gene_type:complete